MNTPLPLPLSRQAPADTDAQVVARVLGGDREAYAVLVRRYQDLIYRHVRGLGLDHDTGVDVVQDALVKGFERLKDCRDAARFKAWLFRIVRNLCFDEMRNVRRRLSVSLSETGGVDVEAPEATPGAVTMTLRAALERVPPPLREAFLLKHDAGYTYDEIAELTEASPSAVKMRVHRAREALRTFLAQQGIGWAEAHTDGCDNPGPANRLSIVTGTERTTSGRRRRPPR